MPLSDFIDKERENRALQNVGKEELVNCLVKGFSYEIGAAAKETYDQVCQRVARDIADGKQCASGYVRLKFEEAYVRDLPEEFKKKGTIELRGEIERANGIRSIDTYKDYVHYPYSFSYFHHGEGRIFKTRLGDAYEAAIKTLLSSDGILCELKVLVTVCSDKTSGFVEKGYIGLNEVFDTRGYHQVNVHPILLYSYSQNSYAKNGESITLASLPKISTTQPQMGSVPAKNNTNENKNDSPFKGVWIFIGIIFVLIMLLDYLFSPPM